MTSVPSRSRGRLTSIAADDVGGPNIKVDNRAAASWLLTLNRLYAPDRTLRTARGLAVALSRSTGPRVVHTTVLRWENLHTRIPLDVLRRYEELFELPAGQLSTIVAGLGGAPTYRGTVAGRTSELVEKCLSDNVVTAVEWADLAYGLRRSRQSTAFWYDLTLRLLTEMTLSTGWRYMLRLSALQEIQRHPQGGPALVAAIEDYTKDPLCQVIVDPVALLAGSRESAVERKLLEMLRSPNNESEFRGSLIAWAARPPRDDARRAEVAAIALECLTGPGTSSLIRQTAADLLASLPRHLLASQIQRAVERCDQNYSTIIQHRLAAPTIADPRVMQLLVTAVTEAQTGRHNDDPFAARLIRHALFSSDIDTRVTAANVLRASPFSGVIAEAVSSLLSDMPLDVGPVTRIALADLLGNLGIEEHRAVLETSLRAGTTDLDSVIAASFALAHMPGRTDIEIWRRVLAVHSPADSLHRAVLYAVGMNHDRAGLELLRRSTEVSADVHRRANWWLRLPGTVMSSVQL
jgi:hypothetical protein